MSEQSPLHLIAGYTEALATKRGIRGQLGVDTFD